MAGTTYKLGADTSSFNRGLKEAEQSVKTLDAALKLNKKQLDTNGDSELAMANKGRLLSRQLTEQQKVVNGLQKSLEEMRRDGVDEASEAYQKLERRLYSAQGKMLDIQGEINSLGAAEQEAAKGANEMADNLASINKKVSFDAVITGVGKITDGISAAIKGAINLGETLFDEFKDAAKWADDTATMAQMYEIPLEKFLQMQALVGNGMDTSVDAMLGGMQQIKKRVGKESKETMDTLQSLGLITTRTIESGFVKVQQTAKLYSNSDDLFWKAGQAIMNMGDAFDKEAAAQALFGKSWRELIPLFSTYRSAEEYSKALEDVTTNSTGAVEALAEANDALSGLETSWQTLKYETLGALAPAISEAAGVLQQLLDSVTEYLKTDAGQELLKNMGDAVGALFEDLSKIDPEDVVKNFVKVFDQLKDAFLWVKENWSAVKVALEGIVGVFAVGKIVSGASTILSLVNGLRQFGGGGTPEADAGSKVVSEAGKTAGRATGGTAAKAGLFSRASAWFADAAGVSAGGALIGTGAIAAGVIALGETVKELNRQWRGTVQDDAHRYDNLGTRDQQVIQTTIRGIMGGESPMSREWQMRWFAQNMGGRIWDAFNYTDAGTGEQRNRLGVLLGMDNAKSAEAFALIAQAYGLRKDRMGNYDLTSSAALQSLMNSDAELNRLITGGATSYAMYQQTGNKVDYANLWQDLTSFFEGSMMKDGNGQYWTPELYAEKLKADEEAAAKVTELGNSSDHTGEFVRLLGEESETSAGHVSKFGELAGGAEHSVDALGGAAARAAGALASIHAPTWATHANGIWDVPWDGYPAILHKGERVTPAREMAARSFSSNLYVENMNMGGGMDADALAAAIAGRNRRMMAGYGS